MSYNITSWKLKKLENLVIPFDSFFKYAREDWFPKVEYDKDINVYLTIMESKIMGKVIGNKVHVKKIDISGEGSGTFMNEVVEPALTDSEGELEAVCIWEGGDSITRLKVIDGQWAWGEIDL